MFVTQTDRDSINFRLDQPLQGLARYGPSHAGDELPQSLETLFRKQVIEGQHRYRVPHLPKSLARLAPDPPGRRIRRCKVRILFLEIPQLAKKDVVFLVGDFLPRLFVVEPVMALNLAA